MQTRLNRQDENQGFDVQSSVQRSPLSPLQFEQKSAPPSTSSQRMDNPKVQLKRAQEYGFNFAEIPVYPSASTAIQRNVAPEEEKDVATTAQMKRDGTVQRDAEEEEDGAVSLKVDPTVQRDAEGEGEDDTAQLKSEGTVQRDGEGEEGGPKVVPDGPRQSFDPKVQQHFKESGMNHAANTKMIVNDEAAKREGALAYTTTQNGQAYTVAQQKVAHDPSLQIHEGTHSEQQKHFNVQPDNSNTIVNSSQKYEAEADANAKRFSEGKALSIDGVQLKSQEDMA